MDPGGALVIGQVLQWLTDPAHWTGPGGVPVRTVEHIGYSLVALAVACGIAIPAGMWIGHTGRGTFLVAGLANGLRALPTLGLLILAVLLIAPLISNDLAFVIPSLIALVVLGVPPMLSGTYAGIQNVDPAARDAAYGMGMSGRQVLCRVELPCALPLIFSGVRSSLLQIIATATIAAYVSLGGLGRFIIDGQAQHDFPQMLSGAVLVAALALLADLVISVVQRLTVSRGLTGRYACCRLRPGGGRGGGPGGPGGDRDRALSDV